MGEQADYVVDSLDYFDDGMYDDYDNPYPVRLQPIQLVDNHEWITKEEQIIDLREIGIVYARNIARFIDRSKKPYIYFNQRQFIKEYWKV
jgi:hypothetical protein